MPAARSLAEAYHRLTKYTEANVRSARALDWSSQPKPFKEIVSRRRVPLRGYLPFARDPFTGESITRAPDPPEGGFGLPEISRLLFFANGVTGMVQFEGGGGQPLRAAPSAGALYPTETYVAVRDLPGLDPGVYNYQVHTHELVGLWEGDYLDGIRDACGGPDVFAGCRACVLLTGIFLRSAWRYQERGYRRVLLDTGHVLGNLVAFAPHERAAAVPVAGFRDAALNGLFFLDESVEGVLACAPLLAEVTECVPEPLLASATTRAGRLAAVRIDAEEDLARSATIALHRGSACVEAARPPAAAGAIDPPTRRAVALERGVDLEARVPEAILRRRSARAYADGRITREQLGTCLGFALGRGDAHGAGRPVRFATREAGILQARLVAVGVEGVDPGVYEVEGAGEALAPFALGDFRRELFHLSLEQEIAGRCAAALAFVASSREAIARWGDRAYRYLHLDAGHAGERLQLAASALGLGACGVAGFLDDEAASLLGIEPDDFTLYLVTVGPS